MKILLFNSFKNCNFYAFIRIADSNFKIIVLISFLIAKSYNSNAQLTDSWKTPNGFITLNASKQYFIVDWKDTTSFNTIVNKVNNSGYPLANPDTLNFINIKSSKFIKLYFSGITPVSDSTFVRCYRYFRDSLGAIIETVLNTYIFQGQTYEETNSILVRIKLISDTTTLKSWAATNNYHFSGNILFDRLFLLNRLSSNKISTACKSSA